MTKAVALLSGGLDSTLAVKMIIDQGIEVIALNFTSAFCTCNAGSKNKGGAGCKGAAAAVAEDYDIPIKVIVKGPEYMDLVRNPKFGHGKGMNPCVDCRIFMFKEAKKYMEEIGASFVITGEVLGQRPMSQLTRSMRIVEEESGLKGLILRPLCAQILEPTIAEKEGLVDREKLLSIEGRSRKPQIALAEELELNDYPCPSGGCLLTDKIFSKKVRDLLEHKEKVSNKDLALLKTGRHFRFNDVKVVVGRDETENNRLCTLIQPGDSLIEPLDFTGPSAIVCQHDDVAGNGIADFAGRLLLRYSAGKGGESGTLRSTTDGVEADFTVSETVSEEELKKYNLC